MRLNQINVCFLGVLLLLGSCHYFQPKEELGEGAVASINGNILTLEDIDEIIPDGASSEDSTILAQNYIKNWAVNMLLYSKAQENIHNSEDIAELIENYKKTITIHYYLQQLVNERVGEPTEDEITQYYENNNEGFPLHDVIIQGALLKLPTTTLKREKTIKNFQKLDEDALEDIEKFCIRNSGSFDYFTNQWYYLKDVIKNTPFVVDNMNSFVSSKTFVQASDSMYTYYLNITDHKVAGDIAPIDFVADRVRAEILNHKKNQYILSLEEDLYNDAIINNEIVFNKKD